MYLDVFTLSALVDEFLDVLAGGRIQDCLDVDQTGIGLEIYASHKRHYLYVSADHHTPRIHLVPDKLRRGLVKPTQLGQLFRRYVEGGVLAHVSQPTWERIIHLDVEGPEGDVTIIVEPMERRSNILLVQGGVVLDCMRRVGPEENRLRLSLPNHAYVPPPAQVGKRDPFNLTLEDVLGFFQQNDDPRRKVHQVLTGRLLGVSPLLAKEVVYRASGDVNLCAEDAYPQRLIEAIGTVMTPLRQRQWQPGIAETEGAIQAYSVYPLEHLPGWRPVASVSDALNAYYGAAFGEDAYQAAKQPVHGVIHEAQEKLRAKLASLERSLTDDTELETLRQSGELILAYQYTLDKGQTELHAQYDPEKPELVVTLDPQVTPVENAQRYFERYNKAKRARDEVPALIETTRTQLDYLSQLATDLELSANWPEIDEVRQALQGGGYWRGKPVQKVGGGRSGPLRVPTQQGFVIWVGRNSRQNEIVTFDKASPQDLWLHARGVPGAHVVIRSDSRQIPDAVIEQAAAIAAYYSAARSEGKVIVDITQRRHVRKIKGAGPGMVTYRNEITRTVTPRSESDLA